MGPSLSVAVDRMERTIVMLLQHGGGRDLEDVLEITDFHAVAVVLRQQRGVVETHQVVLLEAEDLAQAPARQIAVAAAVRTFEGEVDVGHHRTAFADEPRQGLGLIIAHDIRKRQQENTQVLGKSLDQHLAVHERRRHVQIEQGPNRPFFAAVHLAPGGVRIGEVNAGEMKNADLGSPPRIRQTPPERRQRRRRLAAGDRPGQRLAIRPAHAVGAALEIGQARSPAPVHEALDAHPGRLYRLRADLLLGRHPAVVEIAPVAAALLDDEHALAELGRHAVGRDERTGNRPARTAEQARTHDVAGRRQLPDVVAHAHSAERAEHLHDRRLRGPVALHDGVGLADHVGEMRVHEFAPVRPRRITSVPGGGTARRTHLVERGEVHGTVRSPRGIEPIDVLVAARKPLAELRHRMGTVADGLAVLGDGRLAPEHPACHASVARIVPGQGLEMAFREPRVLGIVQARQQVRLPVHRAATVRVNEAASAIALLQPSRRMVADGIAGGDVQDRLHAMTGTHLKQAVGLGKVELPLAPFDAAPFAEAVQARVAELDHLRDVRSPFRRIRPDRPAERRVHVADQHPLRVDADLGRRRQGGRRISGNYEYSQSVHFILPMISMQLSR